MFGRDAESDHIGHPIMDLCVAADRPALKVALVACLRGKWRDSKLNIKGLKADHTNFPVAFSMEIVEFDGEPAVRMFVAADHPDGKTPISLVEQAIQRPVQPITFPQYGRPAPGPDTIRWGAGYRIYSSRQFLQSSR